MRLAANTEAAIEGVAGTSVGKPKATACEKGLSCCQFIF